MAVQPQINESAPRATSDRQDKSQNVMADATRPQAQLQAQDNQVKPLSDRDRDIFLAWMESDSKPNEALVEAVRQFKQEGF
jgi:hypothetical protein